MTLEEFQNELRLGIPDPLPEPQPYDPTVNHAPKRKDILTPAEKKLAIRNALRYFPAKHHKMLAKEFAEELQKYGRIYMYRLRPTYKKGGRVARGGRRRWSSPGRRWRPRRARRPPRSA